MGLNLVCVADILVGIPAISHESVTQEESVVDYGAPMDPPITNTNHPDTVTMIGLDFGSTTSSAMVATARVDRRAVTGRMGFGVPRVVYRSDPVFTPFDARHIDPGRLNRHLDQWIAESGVNCEDLFAGGAIITGLAARKANADAVVRLVRERIGEAVIATADDPRLESWLAFMGSCSVLSRFHGETPMINIDIGGGTTNSALGIAGNVTHTGCHFVGARHFRFEPGTYRLRWMSSYGRALCDERAIRKGIGDVLSAVDTNAILSFYIAALEAIATGNTGFFDTPAARLHQQVPFDIGRTGPDTALVFSGGVGELVYRCRRGLDMPGTTHYGDLGIDLALRIVQSPLLSAHLDTLVPENMGRATVYGLALHSMEVSGSTIFLSDPAGLPLANLPVVARLPVDADGERIRDALSMVAACPMGACIQVVTDTRPAPGRDEDPGDLAGESLASIKEFGHHLNRAGIRFTPRQQVVLLVPGNYGHVLGNYASDWRQSRVRYVVIDEIPDRHSHFVNIGRRRNAIVPVSFYGVH